MTLSLVGMALGLAAEQGPSSACGAAAEAALARAAGQVSGGDFTAAADGLRLTYDTSASCPTLQIAAWSWRGWAAAAIAADRGGEPASLAPVREAIEAVTSLGPPRSAAAYAAALLNAAVAAAQDERDEMLVWLDEARAVSMRLTLLGTAPVWPLPIDTAEGELWHGVDDFELAEAAFQRALAAGDSAVAWRGLARARDRRGNRRGACDAYQRALDGLASDARSGLLASEARGYLLLCAP